MGKFYDWCVKNPKELHTYRRLMYSIDDVKWEIKKLQEKIEYIKTNKELPDGLNVGDGTSMVDRWLGSIGSIYKFAPQKHEDVPDPNSEIELPELSKLESHLDELTQTVERLREKKKNLQSALSQLNYLLEARTERLPQLQQSLQDFCVPEHLSKYYRDEDGVSEDHLDYPVQVLFWNWLGDFDVDELETYTELVEVIRDVFEPTFDLVLFKGRLATAKSAKVSFTRTGFNYREAAMAALITWINSQWDFLLAKMQDEEAKEIEEIENWRLEQSSKELSHEQEKERTQK